MTVDFEITMDDLVEFNLHHIERSPAIQKNFLLQKVFYAFIVMLVVMAMGIIIQKIDPEGPLLVYYIPGLIVLLPIWWFFIYPRSFRKTARKNMEKMFKEGKNKAALGKQRLIVTPEGLTEHNEAGEITVKWGAVEKMDITENLVLLYYGAAQAFLVPKKAFTVGGYTAFLNEIGKYLGRK